MNMNTDQDSRELIAFWDSVFSQSIDSQYGGQPENLEQLAPAGELYSAAASLGKCRKVLDYGCGSGWASIIAAAHGCPDITAADPAPGAVKSTTHNISLYGMDRQIHPVLIDEDWLSTVPDNTYDGIFCSNVLDVIPERNAEYILRQFRRIAADDAEIIIGMNYYLSPERAAERNLNLVRGRYLYVDGILRLVSRTDEEWADLFSPFFRAAGLTHFAWPHETAKTRRLFRLRRH